MQIEQGKTSIVCVCMCVSVISSSSASREREVYRAKGERGFVPRTDFAFSLAATFDTCYAFVCCPSRGRGQRRGSPLFPFYCVLKYLHNENEAFPYTHTCLRVYVCVCVFMSVCPNTLFFGALACLIYERCCVCSLLLLLPCVVVVVLLVPAVLLFSLLLLLLLTQSYTYDMIFYTRLPIMTC